ncbi:MAG: redox-sensing transcriptional repressor Rex [Erysipelotrichaceae bacterium]|nr:redox-sensing transcriptional repressor Rex [Erysipelotrichaceae bacterium]
MEDNKIVPKATLQRYPIYLKALRHLKEVGITRIMSKDLSSYVAIEPTTIRRDFSFIGKLGKQGYGYDVDSLIEIFSSHLGLSFDEKIILVGAGNLGKALLNYNKWNNVVGEIICAFDLYPEKVQGSSVPVYPISEISNHIPKGCRIAILTVTQNIQETVDILIENGITGIVDFTSEHFVVPKGVSVKVVSVVASIQELVFDTNAIKK